MALLNTLEQDAIITLNRYAEVVGKSPRQIQRNVKEGKLVSWVDPFTKKRVTSLASIERVRRAAQAAAEAELVQNMAIQHK